MFINIWHIQDHEKIEFNDDWLNDFGTYLNLDINYNFVLNYVSSLYALFSLDVILKNDNLLLHHYTNTQLSSFYVYYSILYFKKYKINQIILYYIIINY